MKALPYHNKSSNQTTRFRTTTGVETRTGNVVHAKDVREVQIIF